MRKTKEGLVTLRIVHIFLNQCWLWMVMWVNHILYCCFYMHVLCGSFSCQSCQSNTDWCTFNRRRRRTNTNINIIGLRILYHLVTVTHKTHKERKVISYISTVNRTSLPQKLHQIQIIRRRRKRRTMIQTERKRRKIKRKRRLIGVVIHFAWKYMLQIDLFYSFLHSKKSSRLRLFDKIQ